VAEVRRGGAEDAVACADLTRLLPDHFSENVPDEVRRDVERHGAWLVVDGQQVVSFVVVELRGQAAEILWMASHPEQRRRGYGTRLIQHAFAELRAGGLRLVEVKTLDASAGYEPYDATHAFWQSCGFIQIDTIDPLPGWQPGNPAAIYVVSL
jgi:GNAT superfamily N-acetyltransferase